MSSSSSSSSSKTVEEKLHDQARVHATFEESLQPTKDIVLHLIATFVKDESGTAAVQFFKEYGKELVGEQWEGWFALMEMRMTLVLM